MMRLNEFVAFIPKQTNKHNMTMRNDVHSIIPKSQTTINTPISLDVTVITIVQIQLKLIIIHVKLTSRLYKLIKFEYPFTGSNRARNEIHPEKKTLKT